MKRFTVIVGLLSTVILAWPCAAQPGCSKIVLQPRIEVGEGSLSLAELLPSSACTAPFHTAASRVPLGRAPLPGSARSLTGDEVRRLLSGLSSQAGNLGGETEFVVPERITLTQSAARMSCADIAKQIAKTLQAGSVTAETAHADSRASAAEHLFDDGLDCGIADRVPGSATLKLTKIRRDPASGHVEFSLRCIDSRDCVPFLARAKSAGRGPVSTLLDRTGRSIPQLSSLHSRASYSKDSAPRPLTPMVRPGQKATLLWERNGIRMVLPVICLDRGNLGDSIRVRVKSNSRVLHAEVESAGVLRASL